MLSGHIKYTLATQTLTSNCCGIELNGILIFKKNRFTYRILCYVEYLCVNVCIYIYLYVQDTICNFYFPNQISFLLHLSISVYEGYSCTW